MACVCDCECMHEAPLPVHSVLPDSSIPSSVHCLCKALSGDCSRTAACGLQQRWAVLAFFFPPWEATLSHWPATAFSPLPLSQPHGVPGLIPKGHPPSVPPCLLRSETSPHLPPCQHLGGDCPMFCPRSLGCCHLLSYKFPAMCSARFSLAPIRPFPLIQVPVPK